MGSAPLGHRGSASLPGGLEATGTPRNVISGDLGQPDNPAYPNGLRTFGEALVAEGLSEVDVSQMMSTIPARLLGLGSRSP